MDSVIWGKKLFVHIISKNSLNFSRSSICSRFILKSPTIVMYLFSLCNISIICENSVINFEMFSSLLLSWGGLYILPIVNGQLSLGPETSIDRPSQMSECLYKVLRACVKIIVLIYQKSSVFWTNVALVNRFISRHCNNDRSALALNYVSCRQMAPKNIPKEDNKFILAVPKGWFNITHIYVSWFTEVHYFVFMVKAIWHYMIETICGANKILKGIFVCCGTIRHIQRL